VGDTSRLLKHAFSIHLAMALLAVTRQRTWAA
jgi:hypothetical protein